LGSSADNLRSETNSASIRWFRIAILICSVIALYLLGRWVSHILIARFSLYVTARNEPLLHRTIMTATAVYIVFMAIPFMPAVEIGLSMLVIFGPKISFLVYVSTVVALTLAYLVGRVLPARFAAKAFGLVGLTKTQNFVDRLAQLSPHERMVLLTRDSPARLVPHVVRHRFIALAVLLNIPGNVVIGGGGGIALLAGMTRLFPFPAYLFTVPLAVAPVPLFVSFTEWLS
jgi:hypothetical protein